MRHTPHDDQLLPEGARRLMRAVRHGWIRVPEEPPATALRLASYLGGLTCLGSVGVLYHLQSHGPHLPRLFTTYSDRGGAVLLNAALLGGLTCAYLSSRSTLPRWLEGLERYRRRLVVATLVSALSVSGYSLVDILRYPNDVAMPGHHWDEVGAMTDCAARLTLQGRNPYTAYSLLDCLARHGLSVEFTHPLRAGAFAQIAIYPSRQEMLRALAFARQHRVQHPAEFESSFSYPAGTFLWPLPFVALGERELRAFYLAWLLGAYLLLAKIAPRRFVRWLIPLALANIALWDAPKRGFPQALSVCLVLAGWSTWRRSRLSAILLGTALASRQDSWPFALFYTVLGARTVGWRALMQRLAWMGAAVALTNGPFALRSPQAWFAGVVGSFTSPAFPRGQGVVALSTSGWLPLGPRSLYLVLELVTLALCLVLYARTCRRHPGTGVVLALVPLIFSWRTLFVDVYLPLSILSLWPLLDDLRTYESIGGGSKRRP